MSDYFEDGKVLVYSSYVQFFGADAAVLLSQIRYWFLLAKQGKSRCVVSRGETKWVAHSRQQYSDETGLSLPRIRRALERLQQEDVIVVEQHLFAGKNVSFIRPVDECWPGWPS